MAQSQLALSAANGPLFLTDGGMETTLVFHDGWELPSFAAFPLLDQQKGRQWLTDYFGRYLQVAAENGFGFILDTPTWRANPDWGPGLGYDLDGIKRINKDAIAFAQGLQRQWEDRVEPILISGAVGPRGDGYKAGRMDADEAEDYHRHQVSAFAEAGADLVTAYTLSTADEAVGITRAAMANHMPVVISFTVETDGRLASRSELGAAIQEVDRKTHAGPAYYMINCAHPTHFVHILREEPFWAQRIRGIRANASTLSHAELDDSTTLDDGDPVDLGKRYAGLRQLMPQLIELGGCCGTDHRHVEAIAKECRAGVAA